MPGEHRYTVAAQDVRQLVASLREKELWSLPPVFHANLTDFPTFTLTVQMGDQVHQIKDYDGLEAGMPASVRQFEEEVDQVARSARYLRLSQESLVELQKEGFAFPSQAGADLLVRAMKNPRPPDEKAVIELIHLGAPITGGHYPDAPSESPPADLMELALQNRRTAFVAPLLSKGILTTNDQPDRKKIDSAFRFAIQYASLSSAQAIWTWAGGPHRPDLYFDDRTTVDGQARLQRSSVILLLPGPSEADRFDVLSTAKWLVSLGCELTATRADGRSLKQKAVDVGNHHLAAYIDEQTGNAQALPDAQDTK